MAVQVVRLSETINAQGLDMNCTGTAVATLTNRPEAERNRCVMAEFLRVTPP